MKSKAQWMVGILALPLFSGCYAIEIIQKKPHDETPVAIEQSQPTSGIPMESSIEENVTGLEMQTASIDVDTTPQAMPSQMELLEESNYQLKMELDLLQKEQEKMRASLEQEIQALQSKLADVEQHKASQAADVEKLLPMANEKQFYVQVASFRKSEKTTPVLNKLHDMGINAQTKTVQVSSGTWHRIYFGPFAKQQDAYKMKISVSQRIPGLSSWISYE